MLVACIGAVALGIGTRHGMPPWLAAGLCLLASIIVVLFSGWWAGPLLTLIVLTATGMGVNHGAIARPDAYVLTWLVAVGGSLGPGLALYATIVTLVIGAIRIGPTFIGVAQRRVRETALVGASLVNRMPVLLAQPETSVRQPFWPGAVIAAGVAGTLGVFSVAQIGGSWWTTLPPVL